MAWRVEVKQVTDIREHTNADTLELLYLDGWQLVVRKGQYSVGDLVSYFPSDSIIPERWLEEWDLTGKLSGTQKNRVRPVRLRGERSIGLVCHAPEGVGVGEDVQEYYGIVRWEMPIPVQLSGKVTSRPNGFVKYDVDNIENHSNPFSTDDQVVVTEKIHGTNTAFGIVDGEFVVCSRNYGLHEDENNTYWRVARGMDMEDACRSLHQCFPQDDIWIHGEIYGVQDMKYGLNGGRLGFRAFDVRVRDDYMNFHQMSRLLGFLGVPVVPVFYKGQYHKGLLDLADGNESVSGKEMHIREGIVIRAEEESKKLPNGDRKILKVVSDAYLYRKGGTEFH